MDGATPSPAQESVQLRPEVLARCARRARRDGVFAGLTSGLVGGLIGSRLLRFDKNKTLFCAILTGTLSGYFFTQAFLGTHIAEAATQEAILRRSAASSEFTPDDGSNAVKV